MMENDMNYSILDPTGNITAIITDHVDAELRAEAAERVMKCEKSVEQVGFLLPGNAAGFVYDAELQMAGGEFCGNASMSAAAMVAMQREMNPGEKCCIVLKVSGADGPVPVELEALSRASFRGRVSMPRAQEISEVIIPEAEMTVPVVKMPGITHVIVPESLGLDRAERLLPLMCRAFKADAMGMMLIDEAWTRITPVVYVPGADTLVRENSCASGTAAVGAYIASLEDAHIRLSFSEPGGTLTVEAEPKGPIFIEGCVSYRHPRIRM